jgi:hypothetical protein
MDTQERGLVVLARIPDLRAENPHGDDSGAPASGRGRLSSGRWMSPSLSYRLLAGLTLCLLVGAVVPYVFSHSPAQSEPVGANSLGVWQVGPVKDLGDTPGRNRAALKEATLVRAAAESLPSPGVAGRQPAAGGARAGRADEAATWSQWPNPQQVEYEADSRANGKSPEPPRDGVKH